MPPTAPFTKVEELSTSTMDQQLLIPIQASLFNPICFSLPLFIIGNRLELPWLYHSPLFSHTAAYDSEQRYPYPRCHPGTRAATLNEINCWLDSEPSSKAILWLHGPAGAGKSAIAQTIAEQYAELGRLAASFFFFRTDPSRNARTYLLPTLTVQIAIAAKDKRAVLDDMLKADPGSVHRTGGFVDILAALFEDSDAPHPYPLVVIDGLDECSGNADQHHILNDIRKLLNRGVPLRFLIVSRPESQLREAFHDPALRQLTLEIPLYGDYRSREEVRDYLQYEFSRICDSPKHLTTLQNMSKPWPSNCVIKQLVDKSDGYFIYPSTVIRFIDTSEYDTCVELLDQVLNKHAVPGASSFNELDKLYMQILLPCPSTHRNLLKRILGFCVFPMNVLWFSVRHVEQILKLPAGKVTAMLRGLRSLVHVEEAASGGRAFYVYHTSFTDFLVDSSCSGAFYVDKDEWHKTTLVCALSSLHPRLNTMGMDDDPDPNSDLCVTFNIFCFLNSNRSNSVNLATHY
jgi:hypothetical protein